MNCAKNKKCKLAPARPRLSGARVRPLRQHNEITDHEMEEYSHGENDKMTVEDIKVTGKKVLVRCDFNVPIKDGKITSDKRIVAALPTIKKLIADGGKVILCSHLGKPKNGPEEKFSLAPVAERLSEYLGKPVVFANDDTVVGENAKAAVAAMNDGDVVLL